MAFPRGMFAQRNRLLIRKRPAVYHLISRTACLNYLFGSAEKEMFVSMLIKQTQFAGVDLLSYCIMSNHVHLLVRVNPVDSLPDAEILKRYGDYYGKTKVPQSSYSLEQLRTILAAGGIEAAQARKRILSRMGELPAFMRELKQRFTIWYNHKHENQGTIWSARYKSLIVEDTAESLTRVSAYIDLNPVRAKTVDDPKDYRWCSYAAAAAGRKVEKNGIRQLFPEVGDRATAMRAYRFILYGKGYLSKSLGDKGDKDQGTIRAETLDAVMADEGQIALHDLLRLRIRYFSDGAVLGSREFIETFFREHRDQFGEKRDNGASPLPSNAWGQLHVLRNLKRRVYG